MSVLLLYKFSKLSNFYDIFEAINGQILRRWIDLPAIAIDYTILSYLLYGGSNFPYYSFFYASFGISLLEFQIHQ